MKGFETHGMLLVQGSSRPSEPIPRTVRPQERGALLPFSGRAVQAWWLRWLSESDPALAERLHAESARRPYTCSLLMGLPTATPGKLAPVAPDCTYTMRIAAWDAAVIARLAALIEHPPALLTLGTTPFAIVQAAIDPATPPTTFAALTALRRQPPASSGRARDVTLHFLTATSFRQAANATGRPAPLPFPAPASVWGGLFDRWQAVTPAPLEPVLRDHLTTRVAVGRFEGRSQRVLLTGIGDPEARVGATGGQWVVGFVGHCTYWWPRGDDELGSVPRLLATFAGYAGVDQGDCLRTGQGTARTRWRRALDTGARGPLQCLRARRLSHNGSTVPHCRSVPVPSSICSIPDAGDLTNGKEACHERAALSRRSHGLRQPRRR